MQNDKLQKNNYTKGASSVLYNLKFDVNHRGIASLPTILLLGAIMLEVGIASVFLLSYLNTSVYGTRLSNQALVAAQSGVNDAVIRIILNKNCGADSACAPLPPSYYTLNVDGATAEVTICNTCVTDKHQIVSVGKALTRRHRLVTVLEVDPITGLVLIDSIRDEAAPE